MTVTSAKNILLFCTPEQIESEVANVCDLIFETYKKTSTFTRLPLRAGPA